MTNPDLLCPDCNQYGYVTSTDARTEEALLGAICHCCGHVLDKDEVARHLRQAMSAKTRHL